MKTKELMIGDWVYGTKLKRNGRVICCGWNTNGLGKGRGFEMTSILIVSHGGSKNDTSVTLEYKL